MATAIRTISHEDRLSLVEHLDELRTRLIISGITLAVAFGVCFWQNHALLRVVNAPLEKQTKKQVKRGSGPLGQAAVTQEALLRQSAVLEKELQIISAGGSGLTPGSRAALAPLEREFQLAVARVPRTPTGDKPVTLGIGEPFTTTVTITFYFALIFSLPIILFQLYGFLLPAFSPNERRVALPLMLAIPFLFVVGVAFGYLVVLPAAVKFFQNFNSDSFNVLVQANAYYRFEALTLLAMGLIFQVPVAILAAVRAGIVTPKQLRKNRRYAVVVSAAVAALLPGDAVTMTLEAAPLIVLYEASILIASFFDRRDRRRAKTAAATEDGAGETGERPPTPVENQPVPPIPPATPPPAPQPPKPSSELDDDDAL